MKRKEMLERLEDGEDPLELSIEKWQDIVDGIGEDDGVLNCALCNINYNCHGCPVTKRTGKDSCYATPYKEYVDAESDGADVATLKEIAQKEVDFLKSLRESEKNVDR